MMSAAGERRIRITTAESRRYIVGTIVPRRKLDRLILLRGGDA
jgi:hypothetical protein